MIILKKIKFIISCVLVLGILIACGNQKKKNNPGKIKVLSSFSIITDMTKEIGKDKVMVHNLVPIGMAPHNYDPKPADVKFASEANAVIYNGINLEGGDAGWLIKLTKSVHINPKHIFKATKGLKPMYILGKNGEREINPHAFINPKAGILMAENIRDALIATDKENKDFYQKNAEVYIDQLKAVEKEYQEKFSEIPKKDRVFVASEQAFQYLVHQYDLKEGYIWAIDTEKNGSPEQIKRLIAFIEKYHPPVLFVESNVDIRPMETVSKATGVPIYKNPIFSDELGKPGQPADTYTKYLKYNLKQIYNGLTAAK